MLQLTGSFISISLLENFKLITEPCSNTPLKGFFLSDVNQHGILMHYTREGCLPLSSFHFDSDNWQ